MSDISGIFICEPEIYMQQDLYFVTDKAARAALQLCAIKDGTGCIVYHKELNPGQ